jgi:hypothetical protein
VLEQIASSFSFVDLSAGGGMGKKRELLNHWQRACKLILAKEDVLTVSRALELALFMDAKLDVSKVA